MIETKHVWQAIDILAKQRHLSLPELGMAAKLGHGTLFPNKRAHNGKPRWPTVGLVVKVCAATDTSPCAFFQIVEALARIAPLKSPVPSLPQ